MILRLAHGTRSALLAAAILAAATASALGQTAAGDNAEALERTRQQINAAREERRELSVEREALAKDLTALRRKLVTLAQDTQERETIITNLERQLDQLTAERRNRAEDLRTRNAQLAGTLSALARLSPRAFAKRPVSAGRAGRGCARHAPSQDLDTGASGTGRKSWPTRSPR